MGNGNGIQSLAYALTFSGALVLLYSLIPVRHIIQELSPGRVRRQWYLLRAFILLFIAGYILYPLLSFSQATPVEPIVSLIFFCGALFVILVCHLAFQSVQDVKRVVVLERENITDPLMGIFNRRYFDSRLAEEFNRAARYDLPFSLLMIDVDHFKRVNDNYGHQNGDIVLTILGEVIKEGVRDVDIVARYGGEEVAVLLPSTDLSGAEILAERLRQLIEKKTFVLSGTYEGHAINCTISLGVAALDETITGAEVLLRYADAALYQAKSSGRNKVTLHRTVPAP